MPIKVVWFDRSRTGCIKPTPFLTRNRYLFDIQCIIFTQREISLFRSHLWRDLKWILANNMLNTKNASWALSTTNRDRGLEGSTKSESLHPCKVRIGCLPHVTVRIYHWLHWAAVNIRTGSNSMRACTLNSVFCQLRKVIHRQLFTVLQTIIEVHGRYRWFCPKRLKGSAYHAHVKSLL